ncbi:MAG: pilus (MSHA type) biogenesis protein MshL [Methylococcaceae bacterium]|nr:pilus (MSHA type) biogenesis protein MshL [Methylococcaceae bacterium]
MNRKFSLIYMNIIMLLASCTPAQQTKYSSDENVFPSTKPAKNLPQSYPSNPVVMPPPMDRPAISQYGRLRQAGGLNVSVHDVDAREFFMGLVVDTDENMVVHPEVSGSISLELKHVTIDQIMEAVQKVYGYDYKKSDIGWIVYPSTLQTRSFKIDRLDLLREGKSNTFVSSGQTGNTSSGYGNQQSQGLMPQLNNNQPNANENDDQSSGSSITTTTQTDFWKELDVALHALIAVDKEANVVINRQSGVVIARAKPMQLREIENFLATTQNQISRQVILEAKILEVVLNDSHQDGVEWKSIIRQGLQVAPDVFTGGVFTLVSQAGGFRAGDFTAVVSLLESQGKTNVLSSPRISTLNNQQAIIKVGQDETFVTGISPGISGGLNSGTVEPVPILSAFFSGIALDVTPQINDDGDITLHIHPSITKVQSLDRKYKLNGGLVESSVPTALSTIRESDSIVKAKNNQIVVLGGLMQNTSDENKQGVTGVSGIPYLGNLFRVNKGTSQKSELVILLKATLIDSDSDWQNDRDDSHQRFKNLDAQPRWK